jgi:hypothetical protein
MRPLSLDQSFQRLTGISDVLDRSLRERSVEFMSSLIKIVCPTFRDVDIKWYQRDTSVWRTRTVPDLR